MSDIHAWFGLTYANFLVLPRAHLQSMPEEWQERFVECLMEFREHFHDVPEAEQPDYRVQPVRHGRLIPWSATKVPHYNRGRTRVPGRAA